MNDRDFVVVEADRGEDIGIVVEILSMHAFLERRMNAIRPTSAQPAEQEDQNVGCILRLATLHERQQLPDKFHTEKDVVQVNTVFLSVCIQFLAPAHHPFCSSILILILLFFSTSSNLTQ